MLKNCLFFSAALFTNIPANWKLPRRLAVTAMTLTFCPIAAVAQTLPTPNVKGPKYKGTAVLDSAGTVAPALPQFSGPCGTASAGTATFNCNGLLGAAQTVLGAWTFNGGLLTGPGVAVWFLGGGFGYYIYRDTSTNMLHIYSSSKGGDAATIADTITPATNGVQLDTTANSQNRLSRVANMAAVAGWPNTAFPVEVDGTTIAGDGGRRKMTFDSANLCGAGGHPAADGYTCVNSTVVTTGSWNIDWSSVGNKASVALFGSFGTGSFANDTAAAVAATATRHDVFFPAGQYFWTTGQIKQAVVGQTFYSDGNSSDVTIGCYLPSSPGTTNPCLNTNGFSNLKLARLSFYYPGAPDTTSTTDKSQYGPIVYAQNSPVLRFDDVILAKASIDVDMRGNSGGSEFRDVKFSCFTTCWQIDGSLDTNAWINPHGFVYFLTANQTQVFETNATGWDVGRMDDFRIHGGLYIGALAFSFHNNVQTVSPGASFGGITNFDCDTFSCISMSAGTITATNLTSTLGSAASYTASVSGSALLSLVNPAIGISATISAAVSANGGGNVSSTGGVTQYIGANANTFDSSAFIANQGTINVSNMQFTRPVGTRASPACTSNPIIGQATSGARITAIGNRINDLGKASSGCTGNTFLFVPSDGFSKIIGNTSPGWSNSFPSSPTTGTYQFN